LFKIKTAALYALGLY